MLRRAVNLFYGAAAVSEILIGKKGLAFYDWSIVLVKGNDPKWIEPHLPQIVEEVQNARRHGGKNGPETLRVRDCIELDEGGGIEVCHSTRQDEDEGSPHLRIIPNGTHCRLTIDGKTHEGSVQRGMLKIGRRTPFASFSAAFQEIAGRPGKALKAWELRSPATTDWIHADVFIKQKELDSAS
jgi:hypothetical protein